MAANRSTEPLAFTTTLSPFIIDFASTVCRWPTSFLNVQTWGWDDYQGVRYAPLHGAMALRALAGRLHAERTAAGKHITLAQHALADHQLAFRDLQALLLGCNDALLDVEPAPGAWPLRTIVAHVHSTERKFLATILNTLDGGPPEELGAAAIATRTGERLETQHEGALDEIWSAYARVHAKVQEWLAFLEDEELQRASTMWEATPYTVLYRMHRFAAHVREHTSQVETTLHMLNGAPGEGALLARQLMAALAEVEGIRLGMGNLGVAACDLLAEELALRFAPLNEMAAQSLARPDGG